MKKIKNYQEFTNEEINWKKGVATAALGASLLGGLQSCGPSEEEQIRKFEIELSEVEDRKPEDLIETFLKHLETDTTFQKLFNKSSLTVNSQIAYFYKSEMEEYLKFISKILIYKGVIKEGKISIDEIQEFIDRIRNNQQDKFDQMVLDAFDKALEYNQKYLEYEMKYEMESDRQIYGY